MIRTSKESQIISDLLFAELEKQLNKNAVKSRQQDSDLFSQINSVIKSKKSKFSSVAEAVEEMKERSGLNKFLRKAQALKQASANVEIFKVNPEVQQTIKNYIDETGGALPLQAIVEKLKSIYKNTISDDKLWVDENLLKYIAMVNTQVRTETENKEPSLNLGKNLFKNDTDTSESDDIFKSLNPSK